MRDRGAIEVASVALLGELPTGLDLDSFGAISGLALGAAGDAPVRGGHDEAAIGAMNLNPVVGLLPRRGFGWQ